MGKDKYPNFLVGLVTMSAADALTTAEIEFPSLFAGNNMLMEITKVVWQLGSLEIIDATNTSVFAQLSYKTGRTTLGNLDDEDIIDLLAIECRNGAATDSTSTIFDRIITHDLTDADGKGVLIVPQDLLLLMDTTNYTAASTARVRVYFRIVKASSQEVLDLLQQQVTD